MPWEKNDEGHLVTDAAGNPVWIEGEGDDAKRETFDPASMRAKLAKVSREAEDYRKKLSGAPDPGKLAELEAERDRLQAAIDSGKGNSAKLAAEVEKLRADFDAEHKRRKAAEQAAQRQEFKGALAKSKFFGGSEPLTTLPAALAAEKLEPYFKRNGAGFVLDTEDESVAAALRSADTDPADLDGAIAIVGPLLPFWSEVVRPKGAKGGPDPKGDGDVNIPATGMVPISKAQTFPAAKYQALRSAGRIDFKS